MSEAESLEGDFEARQERIVACERCSRLRDYGRKIAREKRRAYRDWDYWGRPVPDFGDSCGRLLIVGLAPGAHGAHRTGRMFTGDRSGDWLYGALHRAGFANQATSVHLDDGLELSGALITAACHCAPPGNKPTLEEQDHCSEYLLETLFGGRWRVVVCLGKLAWDAVFRVYQRTEVWEGARPSFGHGEEVELPGGVLCLGCYHPSQQNTFTGKLTNEMLDAVFARAHQHVDQG